MKNLNLISQRYFNLILILVFFVAVILRWIYLPSGAVTFGYDQARDAYVVQEILGGHLKILGPSVSGVPGLFHGVLYYYVIAPAYLVGHGNPIAVAYLLSLLSSLGVFVIFFLTKLFTKNKTPAIFAALIFAFSFESTQYANWLSNPSLAIIFIPLIYFGIWLWANNKLNYGPILTGLTLGLSIQSNIALAYHILPVAVWIIYSRKTVNRQSLFLFFISFISAISTMIASEIKFNNWGIPALWYLFSSRDRIAGAFQFGDLLLNYLNQIGKVFSLTLFPLSNSFGGLLGFIISFSVLISWFKEKTKKIVSWQILLLSAPVAYLFALSFGGTSTPHVTVGIAALVSVMTGIVIWRVYQKEKLLAVLFLVIILLSNFVKIVSENKKGQTIFAIQQGLILSEEIKAIDYTYKQANGNPFSISTLTSPLFVNTTWSYLYNWYGNSKYGYLPYWVGHDQIGQLGNNLQFAPSNVREHFYIMEPTYSIPEIWISYAKGDQDAISDVVNQKNFGEIVVQERKIKQSK